MDNVHRYRMILPWINPLAFGNWRLKDSGFFTLFLWDFTVHAEFMLQQSQKC